MRESSLFQFSIDNALEIIIIFDNSGKIVYANQVALQLLEYNDELCGESIENIFPGDISLTNGALKMNFEPDGVLRDMMAYRKNRTCFPVKTKVLLYEEAWWAQEAYFRYREQGHYNGGQLYVCMAYDASIERFYEKKADQAGQEAEAALKVKSEFVANVTHELRTPVNGILGNVQELLEQETEPGKLNMLRLVERGCRDMNAIINNILDFSKLEAGKFVLEPRKFEFRNMIDYVKANHSKRIVEKGLDFSVTVSPDIPRCVVGDELRIVQVLNNLISNAYKFTSVGAIHVEVVQTTRKDNQAELFFMVIDSGTGIAKSDQDKLFKSFSQVDASISRKYGGTGLGLNICKQLVKLMGGEIYVESDIGKGSIFSFHVWVEVPEEDCDGVLNTCMCEDGGSEAGQNIAGVPDEQELLRKLQALTEEGGSENIWKYGAPENQMEIDKKMSRLILALEMENWEKAEMFADTLKQLVEEAPREIKSAALRLKMSVQRGDYEKACTAFETFEKVYKENVEGLHG